MPTEWVFRLKDQVSQPASTIESQLRKVTTALKALDIQSKQNQLAKVVDPLRKSRLELQLQRDKLLLSKRAMEEHTGAVKKSAGEHDNLRDRIVRFAGSLYILDSFRRAFAAVGRAASGMADQVRDAVEVQQRGLFGLRSQLGGAGGTAFFGQLERQAQQFGRPTGEIVGMGQSFLQAGATPQNASSFVSAVQDIRASRGAAAAEQFQGAVQSMITSPQFSAGNLQSFAGVFPTQQLYNTFAKSLGIRTDVEPIVVQSMVNSVLNRREVSSARAQGIVQQLVAGLPGQRGQLGTLGTRFAGSTLEGGIGRVQTAWETLLGSLGNSQGMKTLQSVLQNLAKTLGSEQVRTSLRSLADTLGEALKPLTGPAGKKNMQDFFTGMSKAIDEVLPGLKSLVEFLGVFAKRGVEGAAGIGLGYQFAKDMLGVATGNPPERSSVATNVLMSALTGGNIPGAGPTQQRRVLLPTTQLTGRPVTLPPITLQVNSPLVHVDARGATKEDAQAIGDATEEAQQRALNTFLERLNTEKTGGIPP